MGLFSKKTCAICGGDIGLFGNRKLEDGNMCKHCAAKLSPFFSDRRSSTVAEIEEQLAYREANKAKVAAFNVTRSIGEDWKVLLDEDARLFIVTNKSRWAESNPDVMSYADVTNVTYKIDEDKRLVEPEEDEEPQKPASGAAMNNGFAARANAAAVASMAPGSAQFAAAKGAKVAGAPNSGVAARAAAGAAAAAAAAPAKPKAEPHYEYDYEFHVTINVRNPYFDTISFQVNDEDVDDKNSAAYANYVNLCEDLVSTLRGAREESRAAAAPKAAVTCSHCGASTIPDASGRCEYCGSPVA